MHLTVNTLKTVSRCFVPLQGPTVKAQSHSPTPLQTFARLTKPHLPLTHSLLMSQATLPQIYSLFYKISNSLSTSISSSLFSSSPDVQLQIQQRFPHEIKEIANFVQRCNANELPTPKEKSRYYFLRALFGADVQQHTQPETSTDPESAKSSSRNSLRHEALLRSVKFNPNAIEAWNALGHCLWERKDLGGAKKSYERAVLVGKTQPAQPSEQDKQHQDIEKQFQLFWKKQRIIALRELSIMIRLVSNTLRDNEKVKQMVSTSFDFAKEAVFLDLTDGESWTIMGNALLCRYLRSKNMKDMDSALQAYTRALNTPDANVNPQLHYNRANVCKFKQKYQQAFEGFREAKELDPSFDEAHGEVERLTAMMKLIEEIVSKHGGMKKKRLKKFVEQIPEAKAPNALMLIDANGKRLSNAWKEGIQEGKHLTFKVVQLVNDQTDIPLVFIGTDRNANFFLFSIYNVHASAIKDGDLVTVQDPELSLVQLPEEILGKPFDHVNVIAREPAKVILNSRSISDDKIVTADLSMDTK